MKAGVAFSTVSLKPAHYLLWLKETLSERGVQFVQKSVGSIEEAAAFGKGNVTLINATGLGENNCALSSIYPCLV